MATRTSVLRNAMPVLRRAASSEATLGATSAPEAS